MNPYLTGSAFHGGRVAGPPAAELLRSESNRI